MVRIRSTTAVLILLSFPATLVASSQQDQLEDRLCRSLCGRSVVARMELPAHIVGVELDGESGRFWNEEKYRHLIRDWDAAYAPGETASITRVDVRKNEIDVVL